MYGSGRWGTQPVKNVYSQITIIRSLIGKGSLGMFVYLRRVLHQ